MSALILIGCPQSFPCWMIATRYIQAARDKGHDTIRVEKGGHRCEFRVEGIEREIARQQAAGPCVFPIGLIESVPRLEAYAKEPFEHRVQVWPGV